MDTMTAILTRRSVRQWTDKPISDKSLAKILEAGRFSPSPLNSQAWHFTIVKNRQTIKTLSEHAHHGSFCQHAQVLIAVTVDRNADVDIWLNEHDQHIYSGVCAMQNMWLASWDMGIGTCWITLDEKTTRRLLHI
ncbi:MAG: nitroreductase family protein, partial [Candidatus Roizmanbacteria bacterium]